jgi:hypothetical protein
MSLLEQGACKSSGCLSFPQERRHPRTEAPCLRTCHRPTLIHVLRILHTRPQVQACIRPQSKDGSAIVRCELAERDRTDRERRRARSRQRYHMLRVLKYNTLLSRVAAGGEGGGGEKRERDWRRGKKEQDKKQGGQEILT